VGNDVVDLARDAHPFLVHPPPRLHLVLVLRAFGSLARRLDEGPLAAHGLPDCQDEPDLRDQLEALAQEAAVVGREGGHDRDRDGDRYGCHHQGPAPRPTRRNGVPRNGDRQHVGSERADEGQKGHYRAQRDAEHPQRPPRAPGQGQGERCAEEHLGPRHAVHEPATSVSPPSTPASTLSRRAKGHSRERGTREDTVAHRTPAVSE